MAAFRGDICISPSTLLPPSHSTVRLKFTRCSSIPIPKLSKRKNYLRPKILRYLNQNPKETVLIGIEPPEKLLSKEEDGVEKEEEKLQVSSSFNEVNSFFFNPKLVSKYGLLLIGMFAFQTVFAVLFLTESPEKSNRSVENLVVNNRERVRRSNVDLVDDPKMNEKIAEIRAMAREARSKEEDDTLHLNYGGGVEKEIESRLSNMEKRLNSQRKGLAGLRVDVVEPSDESTNTEKSFVFEKKNKFKAKYNDKRKIQQNGVAQGFGQREPSDEVNNSSRKSENRASNVEAIWWLKLPYVLRILMRSKIDQEISEGYFTIRTESMEQNKGQVSHMVAFEDHTDARNFSYLLESVFQDLDDFTADVFPVSTKELREELSSDDKNVIVVKKRQLTLYAGQPFEDVERALHTLIQEQ